MGYTYPESRITFQDPVASTWWEKTIYYDEVNNMDFQSCNVSEAYDSDHPFCNIRACVKRTDSYDKKKEITMSWMRNGHGAVYAFMLLISLIVFSIIWDMWLKRIIWQMWKT